MYHSACHDEPLLNEIVKPTARTIEPLLHIPQTLMREHAVKLPIIEEPRIMRHFLRLSQMNYSIDTGIYPLGSCTMKYNPKISDVISSFESFSAIHPYQEEKTVQGNLQILYELERMLCEITGMDSFTLQPAAGAHGEFTGLLLVRAYHTFKKDYKRNEVIVPDTAHGTNPASATMAGYTVVEIPSNTEGTVDLEALKKALSDNTACFMLTNPNTLGIFESDILTISKLVHNAGALLYYDGANMNAIMGKTRPGDMGFDIVHLNLHKTFSTPHGGGGPGAGPVGVKRALERFLPIPRVCKNKKQFHLDDNHKDSIGKIKGFYGNFDILLRAYVYILLMGGPGLKEASEVAVLNANYMKKQLIDSKLYSLPFIQRRMHEFVISCQPLLESKGIRAMDIAKRLLDYGVHPPTVYFPLIVKEALMIEPTESESKESLDRYVQALIDIAKEDSKTIQNAPTNTSVARVDEAQAVKKPILTWNMINK
jgi:glycine dehydrogenase subunit 2